MKHFLGCDSQEVSKGQLISKCLFCVFNFFQKTNENKSHSSKIEFVRSFFGGNIGLKKSFRFLLTFKKSLLNDLYGLKSNPKSFKSPGLIIETIDAVLKLRNC